MTARPPTKPQPTKRPVVRVVVELYPRRFDVTKAWIVDRLEFPLGDYHRPRVVSVRRVRGGAK